jgi:hypothetical protein
MSVGLTISKDEIDRRAGDTASAFQRAFNDVAMLKSYLDATPDNDMVLLGYTASEVASLKTAWNDLWRLYTVWTGTATVDQPYDFRTFVRRLWGVGAF